MLLIAAMLTVAAGVGGIARLTGDGKPSPHGAPVQIAPVDHLQAIESVSSVRDARGEVWQPDRFAHGGTLFVAKAAIANTAAPALYRRQRIGIESIDVPLRANGSYLVVLYFSEVYGAGPGSRIFRVVAQERSIANVDIAGEVGALMPYHLAFTAAVTHRHLTIRFIPLNGRPVLDGLRVQPLHSNLQLPSSHVVWADDFSGPRGAPPSPARWTHDLGTGWNQLARYTAKVANASLDGHGHLVLAARRTPITDRSAAFTSARLTTHGLFRMRYGTASAHLEVASQPGVVSTFWALGWNAAQVGWPTAGEIDPLEVRSVQPRVLVQAVHASCPRGRCAYVWERALPTSLADGFHTATVERAPGVIIYSIDGRQTGSLTSADVPRGAWVFNRPFSLILNLMVGGWAGTPPASTGWPITMIVDWVRVMS